jgi:cytochrome P450
VGHTNISADSLTTGKESQEVNLSLVYALNIPNWGWALLMTVLLVQRWHNTTRAQIKPILAGKDKASLAENPSRKTVFHTLRDSDLPPHEKTVERLVDEAATFTIAGSESTAQCTSKIMFFLKYYPEALEKLRRELRKATSNSDGQIPNIELQKLPYLVSLSSL